MEDGCNLSLIPIDILNIIAQFCYHSHDEYKSNDQIELKFLLLHVRQCNRSFLLLSNHFKTIQTIKMVNIFDQIKTKFHGANYDICEYKCSGMLIELLEFYFNKIPGLGNDLVHPLVVSRKNEITNHILFWFSCFISKSNVQSNINHSILLQTPSNIINVGYIGLHIIMARLIFIDNVPDNKKNDYFKIFRLILKELSKNNSDSMIYQLVLLIKRMEPVSDHLFNSLFPYLWNAIYKSPSYLRLMYIDDIFTVVSKRKFNPNYINRIINLADKYGELVGFQNLHRRISNYLGSLESHQMRLVVDF